MITTLVDADMVEFYRDMEASDRALRFAMHHPYLDRIRGWFALVWLYVMYWTICRWFDHNIVDDGSYAGPDSGEEALRCTRCGWSWHHIYY